jgi:hypothetical protein
MGEVAASRSGSKIEKERTYPSTWGGQPTRNPRCSLRRTHDDNIIQAAATYAEELAHFVGAQIIDTDLWPQALAEKREQKRAGRADAARWAH